MDVESFQFSAYLHSTTLVMQTNNHCKETDWTAQHSQTMMIRFVILVTSFLRGLLLHPGMIPTHLQILHNQHQKRHHNYRRCSHLHLLHNWLSTLIPAVRGPTCLDTSLPTLSVFPPNPIPISRFHKGITSQCNSGGWVKTHRPDWTS